LESFSPGSIHGGDKGKAASDDSRRGLTEAGVRLPLEDDMNGRPPSHSFDAVKMLAEVEALQFAADNDDEGSRSLGDVSLRSLLVHLISDMGNPSNSPTVYANAAMGLAQYASNSRANHLIVAMGGLSALMDVALAPIQCAYE